MKKFIYIWVFCASFIFADNVLAQNDSVEVRVHFLYGSKPKRKYKSTEDRWFGGVLGGHAGIEWKPNKIINFQPKSRFHLFHKKQIINSKYSVLDTVTFHEILGGKYNDNKRTIVCLKLSREQYNKLDSLANAYHEKSPYDYAFFGMRCGAATYDLLAKSGVLKKCKFNKTWRCNFYPRIVRRKLEKLANKEHTAIIRSEGSTRRIWEKD